MVNGNSANWEVTTDSEPRSDAVAGPTGERPVVLLLSPAIHAVSGVSSHASMLLQSALARRFRLRHFQVGSEGREESRTARCWRLLRDPLRLVADIRRHDASIVHINTSLNARAFWRDFLFMIAARLCRTEVLYQVHGGPMPQAFFRGRRPATAMLRLCLRLPTHIVVLGSKHLEAWQRFLPGSAITAIPNAIDCAPFRHRKARARPHRRLHLLYLGRLANGKGLCELVHALASPVLGDYRPVLTITGSGPEEAYLRERVQDLDLDDYVVFTGPLFGDAKIGELYRADVFVLPSYSEGLPYALLEAMAAGAAVITTPVGAIPDVISAGVHGLFVPPRDPEAIAEAIQSMCSDRERLQAMRRACRNRIMSRYDVERLEADFDAAYRRLADKRAGRGGARIVPVSNG